MQTSAIKLLLCSALLSIIFFACKPAGPQQVIAGTWIERGAMDSLSEDRVTFDKDSTVLSQSFTNGHPAGVKDTAVYKFSADEKYMIVSPRNNAGSIKLKIIELKGDIFKFMPEEEGAHDTITMKRMK
ncbi:MAG TPA: hypothetical protein VG738_17815 [Chitinophagaceae bacterium]|nr:hypothetical protein [Chitinophagaceae bacterium]